MKTFWHEVAKEEPIWNWHIEYLTNELQKLAIRVASNQPKEYDLIINIPPGTTKSLTCSVMFQPWCWTNWHWMKFINISYSAALSLEHAELSRDLVRSDLYRMLFPNIEIKQDKDTKSNFRVVNRIMRPSGFTLPNVGGGRYSTSVGGTLTGFHGHILIVDDPLNPNQAASPVELHSANRWLDQTLSTRKVDKAVTPTVLIMQRLHEEDPTGHLLSKEGLHIHHICLPGEIRSYENIVKPNHLKSNYSNGLLDPVRMGWASLDELKLKMGQYGYAGQIGQQPTPPQGGMFRVDHFNIIEAMPALVNIVQTVRYWDKAGTQDGGAYTVGVKVSKTRDGHYIIQDVKRGQWEASERNRIMKEIAEADGREVEIGVEQEPGSGGKESAEFTIRDLAGFKVYADRPTGDKVVRADPYSAQVNGGNVRLLRGGWNKDFIEEHRLFPRGVYKDQVDATSGAFARLTQKRKAGTVLR